MVPSPREEKARKNSFQHLVQFFFMPDPEQNSDPLLFIAQHVIPKFQCVKKKKIHPYPINLFGYSIPNALPNLLQNA